MKKKLDLATVLGFVMSLGCILGSVVLEHGNIMSYFNISAAMIVFGGSFGVLMVCYPLSVVKSMPKVLMHALREPQHNVAGLIQEFVRLAERARKEGLLALEAEAANLTDPLLRKGITLVVDGTDPEVVRGVMEIEIAAREARHEVGIGACEALGGFAPTLGIMGTVMGMIHILAHIASASEMSASIAVAFTATLYGVGSANLFWLPLASKLKRRAAAEGEMSALIVDGVAAIQAGDNPRIVHEKLAGYMAPVKGKKAAAAASAGAPAGAPSKAGA